MKRMERDPSPSVPLLAMRVVVVVVWLLGSIVAARQAPLGAEGLTGFNTPHQGVGDAGAGRIPPVGGTLTVPETSCSGLFGRGWRCTSGLSERRVDVMIPAGMFLSQSLFNNACCEVVPDVSQTQSTCFKMLEQGWRCSPGRSPIGRPVVLPTQFRLTQATFDQSCCEQASYSCASLSSHFTCEPPYKPLPKNPLIDPVAARYMNQEQFHTLCCERTCALDLVVVLDQSWGTLTDSPWLAEVNFADQLVTGHSGLNQWGVVTFGAGAVWARGLGADPVDPGFWDMMRRASASPSHTHTDRGLEMAIDALENSTTSTPGTLKLVLLISTGLPFRPGVPFFDLDGTRSDHIARTLSQVWRTRRVDSSVELLWVQLDDGGFEGTRGFQDLGWCMFAVDSPDVCPPCIRLGMIAKYRDKDGDTMWRRGEVDKCRAAMDDLRAHDPDYVTHQSLLGMHTLVVANGEALLTHANAIREGMCRLGDEHVQ